MKMIIFSLYMYSESFLLFLAFVKGSCSAARSGGDHDGNEIIAMPLIHRDQVISRRMRELAGEIDDEGFEYHPSGQLYQGLGTHYVDLWVGTPNPQRQTLIVDTGSDLTAFPCDPCPDCGEDYHIDEGYKDEESKTFHLMDCIKDNCQLGACKYVDDEFSYCEVSQWYAEGSHWHAYEVTDQVYIGGPHDKPLKKRRYLRSLQAEDDKKQTQEQELKKKHGVAKNTEDLENIFQHEASEAEDRYKQMHPHANNYSFEMRFACQYKITGLFRTQLADGIMGMENSKNSFWMQMYKTGKISSKRFALCFSISPVVEREGSKAGQLTLGGADRRLHSSPMIYAEHIDKQGWYAVYVRAIYLKYQKDDEDETKIVKLKMDMEKFNKVGIILDSGTTESFLPEVMQDPFHDAFMELKKFRFNETVAEESEMKGHPTIMLQLQSAEIIDDDELMDKNGKPLEGLVGNLDLDNANDVILEIPPEKYLMYRRKDHIYTNTFHMTEKTGLGVVGANVMSDHDILFDVKSKRIGIAKSTCEYVD